MTNYLKKAVFGVSHVFLLSIFSMFFAYCFRLLLARVLSDEEFGLFYAVFAFTTLLHTFHDPGLKAAVIKFIPEFVVKKSPLLINRSITHAFLVWTVLSGIFTVLTIVFSSWLAENYFHSGSAKLLLIVLGFAFLLSSMDYLIAYVFQGFQRMALFAGVDLSRSVVLLLAASIGFIVFGRTALVAGFAYIASSIILTAVYFPVLKRKVFREFRFKLGDKK